jgi:hypothetical protein
VIHIGYSFAYWQRKFTVLRKDDFYRDRRFALGVALAGPCALIVTMLGYTDYGWLWPWGAKAKREAGLA